MTTDKKRTVPRWDVSCGSSSTQSLFSAPSLLASRPEPWAPGRCAGSPALERPENGEQSHFHFHFHEKEFEWITVYNVILLRVIIFLRITKIKIISITTVCPIQKAVLTLASLQGYRDFISSLYLAILHIVTTLEVSEKAVWATQKKILFSQKTNLLKRNK